MVDPAPYLSTIAAVSAAMVAIIGGLLVARFVGLESEQEGARRVLEGAKARLAKAREREVLARDRLLKWEISLFFDRKVVQAICNGTQNVDSLRELGKSTELSDGEIEAEAKNVAQEFLDATAALEATIPSDSRDLGKLGHWEDFLDTHQEFRGMVAREQVWQNAYMRLVARPDPPRPAASLAGVAFSNLSMPSLPLAMVGPPTPEAFTVHRWQTTDGMIADIKRAHQQVEDLSDEVGRLNEIHKSIVRPKGLGVGLAVLALFTAVGVVYPIWILGHAPKNLNRHISHPTFILFFVGLTVLLGYMGWLALRLARGRRSAKQD